MHEALEMAEIGVIASIVEVAGEGFRLSVHLNAISCEVASTEIEVHSIAKDITSFSLMLKQTGAVLQQADSVHSHDAVDTARSIADESTLVFDEFKDMLHRVRTQRTDASYSPTIQQRFEWCFKKHRVTYLLAQLESLKLSLSVMLQILELGKLMASTSKTDRPEEVVVKTKAISQERAEAQNVVIVRYWQMSKMDSLFEKSQLEDQEGRAAAIADQEHDLRHVESQGSQLTIKAAPSEYAPSTAMIRLPVWSLGELDQTLHKIKETPKAMFEASYEAIDPLLERWTRWHEVRERRHARDSGSRFVPSVQNLQEDDQDDKPYHERYRERENSPRGFFLEGTTSDWRKPNSVAARHEAIRRRQQYSGYQPSVSAASSDMEGSSGSRHSKRRGPKHHVIDSSTESSDSESETEKSQQRRRRSSGSPTSERKTALPDGNPVAHSYQPLSRNPNSPSGSHNSPLYLSSTPIHPGSRRPYATPDQNLAHHSISSPLPPVNTATGPLTYTGPTGPYPQYMPTPPPHNQHYPPQTRYAPSVSSSRMGVVPRPVSQDGKAGRSPSRLSHNSTGSRSHTKTDEEKRRSKEDVKRNLREGAAKGILGAGAIGGFLELLEGLSI